MARGARPKEEVLNYLRKHPEMLELTNDDLKRHLKTLNIYSRKTYWKDINVVGIRRVLEQEKRYGATVHDRVQERDEAGREDRGGAINGPRQSPERR